MARINLRRNGETRHLERRQEVTRRYCQGQSQYEIAAALGISQPAVCKHLARIRDEWLTATQSNYSQRVAEELARLDHLAREAWAGYQRSRVPHKPDQPERAGDVRFLEHIHRTLETRAKILGLVRPGSVVVNNLPVIDWGKLFQPADDAEVDFVDRKLREIDAQLAGQVPPQLPGPAIESNGHTDHNGYPL